MKVDLEKVQNNLKEYFKNDDIERALLAQKYTELACSVNPRKYESLTYHEQLMVALLTHDDNRLLSLNKNRATAHGCLREELPGTYRLLTDLREILRE